MGVYFIPWVIIQYYSIYFAAQNVPAWPSGALRWLLGLFEMSLIDIVFVCLFFSNALL